MNRISCDLCTRDLIPGTDARYAVSIVAQLVCEPVSVAELAEPDFGSDLEPDLDTDCIDEMDELLTDRHGGDDDDTVDDEARLAVPVAPINRTFDLCGKCYARFAGNPLGRPAGRVLSFSRN